MGLVCGCAHFDPQPLSAQQTLAAFERRTLADPGLKAFMAANHEVAPAHGGRWGLKALTLVAFYDQPALSEARARLLAVQAARITAAERPNPSISLAPGYDRGVPDVPSPWIVPVTLDWPIETAGKRGDRIAQARHAAAAARWDLVGIVWRVRSRVRSALLDLYAARRRAALLASGVSTLRRVVVLLEGQLRAGSVSSYEVAQARVSLDDSVLAQQAAAGEARQAKVALAGALGVPLRALAGVRFSFDDLEALPGDLTRPQIRRQALLERADVRSALERYAASQSALALEVARQWPDIDLGPGYAWNPQLAGDSEWQLGLTVSLPLLNQNQGPIAEARARRKAAAAHFLAVQAAAITQIDGALAAYRSALSRASTASLLLVDLTRRLAYTRARVEAGELQPLDLSDAQVVFDTGEQSRLDAQVEAEQSLGRLEDAVQSPLSLSPLALRAAQQRISRESP